MTRRGIPLLIGISLALSASAGQPLAADTSPATALARLLRHAPVVLLGETHHRPESTRLVADIIAAYLASGGCLTVALEIAADQQEALDAGMSGSGALSEVVIHPIVDHPSYRAMLARFRTLRQAGHCLQVRALDAPSGQPGPRDGWMAEAVYKAVPQGPVLALVGNLHALKRLRWENEGEAPSLADRLVRHDLPVLSVLQEWDTGCERRTGQFLEIRHPRAAAALPAILSPVAAHPYGNPNEAAEYVVVWSCPEKNRESPND